VTRKLPAWAVEAVAWSASLVLVVGVGVAGSGVITHEPGAAAQPRAATVDRARRPVVQPSQPPAQTNAAVRSRHAPIVLPSAARLGPPPGPIRQIAPARVAAPQDRYAFLVGITDYRAPTHDTLAGDRDVAFIYQYLLANGWLPQNIRVVTNKQATGKAMRSGLAWLVAKSRPGTFTLFHYSGHVKQVGGHEKLWPYDRAFVTDTELAATLKRGTGKLWVDIAGCEAGGFFESLPSSRVLVTASSKRTQKSYEHPSWGESVWVGLMWDAGMAQGQADLDHNGVTTVGEAAVWAGYWAQAVTLNERPYGRQSPQTRGDAVRGWTLANPPA
jgi:hypothetical protein